MKKFLILSAVLVFAAGTAFAAGEINAKLGLDPYGHINTEMGSEERGKDTQFGVNISAEYLYLVHDIIRIGAGFEYLFGRGTNPDYDNEYSYFPLYATILVNPVYYYVPEAYVKANIGYIVSFDSAVDEAESEKGGLYWALGIGYEFDFGILLEAMYGFYYSSYEIGDTVDCSYSKLGINIGYKFRL